MGGAIAGLQVKLSQVVGLSLFLGSLGGVWVPVQLLTVSSTACLLSLHETEVPTFVSVKSETSVCLLLTFKPECQPVITRFAFFHQHVTSLPAFPDCELLDPAQVENEDMCLA